MKTAVAALVAVPAFLSTASANSGKTAVIAIPGETTLTVVAAHKARHTGQSLLVPGGPGPYDLPGGSSLRKDKSSFRSHLAIPRDESGPHSDGDCHDHALAPRAVIAIPHAPAAHIGPHLMRRGTNGPGDDVGEDSDSETDSESDNDPEDSEPDFVIQPIVAPVKRMVLADHTRTEDLGAAFTQQGAHHTVQWPGLPKGMTRETHTATDVMHVVDVPPNHGYGGPGQPPIETMPPQVFITTSYTTHWPDGVHTLFDNANRKDANRQAADANQKFVDEHKKAADGHRKVADDKKKAADANRKAADDNEEAADFHNKAADAYQKAAEDGSREKPETGAAGTVSSKGTTVAMAGALGLALAFTAFM